MGDGAVDNGWRGELIIYTHRWLLAIYIALLLLLFRHVNKFVVFVIIFLPHFSQVAQVATFSAFACFFFRLLLILHGVVHVTECVNVVTGVCGLVFLECPTPHLPLSTHVCIYIHEVVAACYVWCKLSSPLLVFGGSSFLPLHCHYKTTFPCFLPSLSCNQEKTKQATHGHHHHQHKQERHQHKLDV